MTVEGPRGARIDELDSVVKLADDVFNPQEGAFSMKDAFPLLFHEDNADDLRLFLDDGRPISLVGMFQREVALGGTRHRSCCIGSVCTDVNYRGQGLATRLMKDGLAKAVRDGADVFIISGGRSLYRRLGYVLIGGSEGGAVPKKKLPDAGDYSIRPWKPDDLPELVRIHSAERVRFVRGPEDFLAFLSCKRWGPTNAFLICNGKGRPVAYVVSSCSKDKGTGEARVEFIEMAGSRWAIACSLRALLKRCGAEKVVLSWLTTDEEMRAIARSFGWRAKLHESHRTVGIVAPELFWLRCEALLRERLGSEVFESLHFEVTEEGIVLSFQGEKLVLDGMSELTNLVFLPEGARDELNLALRAGSALARVLGRIFPLPLPDYELNFI
ncbi:MAG: GNAT family N-acetyltransferase [Planctomycetes bacterium]|nr:GNAT family N-acetyltransferase [Planctomycetota bacterium]